MSNQFVLKIPQVGDRFVAETFSKIGEKRHPIFAAMFPGQLEVKKSPFNEYGRMDAEWEQVFELDSALLVSFVADFGSIRFTYYRGGAQHDSAVYDEIHVSINLDNAAPAARVRLELIAQVQKAFRAFDPRRVVNPSSGELEANYAALHESTLTRLEQVATDTLQSAAKQQMKLADEYHQKSNALEDELQQWRARLQGEYEEKAAELRKKEEDLARKQASIDDRDNTHARRETRNKLLEDVRNRIENFGVTAATEKKRLPVLMTFLLLFFTLVCFGIDTGLEIQGYHANVKTLYANSSLESAVSVRTYPKELQSLALTKTDLYILWGRLSLMAISVVGLALYFIRWQNRWAEQHSLSEFQLQQFYLDVNRANWVVESGLEWNKETGNPIPGELLDRLTHNLFKAASEPPAVLHPADELASALLGSASKLKLTAGNSEIEFDKPGKIPEKS